MEWRKRLGGEFFELLIFMLVMGVFRTFVYDWLHIPTSSMAQTMHRGDVVLVRKFAYGCSPLSVVWGLGLRFVPSRLKTMTNHGVPYIKYRSVQPGDIVCVVDPVTGINFTKRVIAVSGDNFARESGELIVNGQRCERVPVGCGQYHSDRGTINKYEIYLETLHGTDVSYFVQYRSWRRLEDVQKSYVPDADLVQMPWGKVRLLWFSVCGDNRSESADSVVEITNGVIPKYIPEGWVIGNVAGVICSTHKYFAMHEMVSGITTSWPEWIMCLPKAATLSGVAIVRMPGRVGLYFDGGDTAGRVLRNRLRSADDDSLNEPRKRIRYES